MVTQRYSVTPHPVETLPTCVPAYVLDGAPLDYEAFLNDRRKLMAEKIRQWFKVLG